MSGAERRRPVWLEHFGRDQKSSDALYTKRVDEIQHLAATASSLQNRLVQQTGDIDRHAPQISQASQSATVRAVNFLNSKIPAQPHMGLIAPKIRPSKTDMSKFNRYFDAVHRPTSILKQASAGTLTPEAVEAVRTVYPELFNRMQQSVLQQIAENHGTVPYQSRVMLSLLLGQPMDGTTQPAIVAATQLAYAKMQGPSQPPQGNPGGNPRAENIHSADRARLPSQKLADKG
jgi:hypothetical protein